MMILYKILCMELIKITSERWIKPENSKVITSVSFLELNYILQWIARAAANLQEPSEPIYCSQQRM